MFKLFHTVREEAMAEGASLRAPETVFFSYDTKLGRDVTIEPNVVFGPGVTVHDGVRIRAFSHLEGCELHKTPLLTSATSVARELHTRLYKTSGQWCAAGGAMK